MADLVTKIRTNAGVSQIDYNALANLPDLDTMQTDLTNLQKKIDTKADSADLETMQTTLDDVKKDLDLKAYSTEVAALEEEVDAQFTALQFSLRNYVTSSSLESAGYVTEAQLNENGYVTKTELTTNLLATDDTPGVVQPGAGLTVIDGVLHVDAHPLEDLSNIHVFDAVPDSSEIFDGHWYLIKAEG